MSDNKTNCDCAKYPALALNRRAITKRIKEAKAILKPLVLLGEEPVAWLKLFKCPVCNQYWQSGHEWNFGDQEYLFQVPEIKVEDWLREPYAQPAALILYSVRMQTYFEQNRFEEGEAECRRENCEAKTLKMGAFCLQHHIENLQNAQLLPKKPKGQLFAPYALMSQGGMRESKS